MLDLHGLNHCQPIDVSKTACMGRKTKDWAQADFPSLASKFSEKKGKEIGRTEKRDRTNGCFLAFSHSLIRLLPSHPIKKGPLSL